MPYLFRNWKEFIDILFANHGKVKFILWFEHIEICKQADSMGVGGYRDPDNPEYMFAETMLFDDELENKSLEEIKEHILSVIQQYPNNKLIPSFYIDE